MVVQSWMGSVDVTQGSEHLPFASMEYLWKPQVICYQWWYGGATVPHAPHIAWALGPLMLVHLTATLLVLEIKLHPDPSASIVWLFFFFFLVLVFALKCLPWAESLSSLRLRCHLHLRLSLTLLMSTAEHIDRITFPPSLCWLFRCLGWGIEAALYMFPLLSHKASRDRQARPPVVWEGQRYVLWPQCDLRFCLELHGVAVHRNCSSDVQWWQASCHTRSLAKSHSLQPNSLGAGVSLRVSC